uniref:Xaa-Pro aminopeptidase 2 n=1 Tax=Latimeria chalumnae TaxID=7897 RepID=H3AYY8_LATCH
RSSGSSVRICSISPPYLPPTIINTEKQLKALRQEMAKHTLSAYIIPATDAHLNEYIADRDGRRAWMTGFTGSAGTAVVTKNKATLWTDSRYWIQAERQMDCNWELKKDVWASAIAEWIIQEVPVGEKIGVDPFLLSIFDWMSYNNPLDLANRTLASIETNLVDVVWGAERPPSPTEEIFRLPDEVIGRPWQEKVKEICKQMDENTYQPTAVLLSALDETAWLFNLRSTDIPYNPFFYSYTLLTKDWIRLFVDKSRLSATVKEYLQSTNCSGPLCVQLLDYGAVRDNILEYANGKVKIWIGDQYTTYGLYEVIPENKILKDNYSPVMITKSVKDDKEQQILRESHVRDAVAVIQYLVWLEKNVPKGTVNELSGASYVNWLRSTKKNSKGPSFATISASGLNAALAHYSPSNETNRKLSIDEMYLIDSGGQYLDGTTDITRTVHWGTPTDFQKEAFTRVLMGNIDLSCLIFPPGTEGRHMEILARQALWEVGLDYGHGTGHGIGNFLSVHEWPVGFQGNNIGMEKGMFTSIGLEPGYYHDNSFGIRIEDVALVVEAKTKHMFGEEPYLTFETISLVPYDRKLIDTNIMTQKQIDYLNRYYQKVREIVGQELTKENLQEEYSWLVESTKPFSHCAFVTASCSVLALSLLVNPVLQHLFL